MKMGDRIKELRLQYGMTQEELGAKLGIQKSAIAKYENGRVRNLKASMIKKLAEIFDVRPSYIMGWDDSSALKAQLISILDLPTDDIDVTVYDIEMFRTYLIAKDSDDAVLKALTNAIDKHIKEHARKRD
jgi:transcriptional regulator with XRE-family HTH domain